MTTPGSPAHQLSLAQDEVVKAVREMQEAVKILKENEANPGPDWTRLSLHPLDTENPHELTKAQVGLGNVSNFPQAVGPHAVNLTSSQHFLTPVAAKAGISKALLNATSLKLAKTEPVTTNGHLQVDWNVAAFHEQTVGTATDIELFPVSVSQGVELRLLLTKNVADAPVVRLGNEVGVSPEATKLQGSADDSVAGTFMYTFYQFFGQVPVYRVEALA